MSKKKKKNPGDEFTGCNLQIFVNLIGARKWRTPLGNVCINHDVAGVGVQENPKYRKWNVLAF